MQQHSPTEKDTGDEKTSHALTGALRFQESLLNAAGIALITSTTEGIITTFSPAAEEMLGYAAEDVVGKSATILFHDADEIVNRGEAIPPSSADTDKLSGKDFFQTASRAQALGKREWKCVHKDGTIFPISLTVVELRDESGNFTGFAGIIKDITDHKKLKEQLAISERQFQLLAENVPGAIYLCHNDHTYSIIYLSDYIKTITGYSVDDYVRGAVKFADLIHPHDQADVQAQTKAGMLAKESFHLIYRLRHAAGGWRWIHETRVGVYEGDNLIMLEGFLQDITVQKNAEETLQKTAEENLRFFNNPVTLNAVASFAGILLRISPSWTQVLGWSTDELISRHMLEFVYPDDIQKTTAELEHLSRTTTVHTFENRLICKDGTYRWLLWALASDVKTQMIYASAIDISARKTSEEHILDSNSNLEAVTLQLQKQNRRLDEFAHFISHNLRAPLKNIQALVNLLNDQSEINDYKLIHEKLKNVAKNLGETMNELMDTLKTQTQSHVNLTEIRFKEVLDKVVQSLEGELIVAQADVTFDFNEAPTIRYSKAYLESIFQNLLTNAIKYKAPQRNPVIHFRSCQAGEHIELQVSDNGQGIDMERYGDKIFGLHKTFHEHQEARGVGLFLVKTQVETLGGTISVSSEVGKGTAFTIKFSPPGP